jgi:hypothetical protein
MAGAVKTTAATHSAAHVKRNKEIEDIVPPVLILAARPIVQPIWSRIGS